MSGAVDYLVQCACTDCVWFRIGHLCVSLLGSLLCGSSLRYHSYYFHNTATLARCNDTRSFSYMYTDLQLASFNSQLFFLVSFISSCRLFYSVVCVAAVICFGCACQPCCVVLWELEPASIVSISSSVSLPFPRPAIP